jgi:hypothetical protein
VTPQPRQATVSANPVGQDFEQPSGVPDTETLTAPTLFLVLGLVLASAAILLGVVSDSLRLAGVGWVLGGPLAIGSLAVFLQKDAGRRSQPWYAESSLVPWLRRGLVFLAILAVALNAWTIANAVARGAWS